MANKRQTIAVGLVCLAAAFGDHSKADTLDSTFGDDISETEHSARVSLDGRVAVVVVKRTIANSGLHSDEARLTVDLPKLGAVTGLRMRSGGKWIKGTIAEAETAAKEYRRLTQSGAARADGPALMSWVGTNTVELAVFPVRKGAPRAVEYTVRVGTCYRDGLRVLGYPNAGVTTAPRVDAARGRVYTSLTKAPLRAQDAAEHCSNELGGSVDDFVWVTFEAPAGDEVASAFGSHDTGFDQRITRLEIDAREELGAKPRKANVVFVIDASHTEGRDGIAAQIELAKAYLAHVPDATFEVVLYRRYAERLLGRFAPAREADSILSGIRPSALDPNNGSNLDEGLGLAGTLLADAKGPARVVAFTDSRLRIGFDNAAAIHAFRQAPKQTVLHIIDHPLDLSSISFARFDGHDLAPVADAFGGILISQSSGESMWTDVETSMLALVRPMQIDSFRIEGFEIADAETVLREGESVRHMEVMPSDNAPDSVMLTGKIWARAFAKRLDIDAGFTRELPAMVFGTDHWSELAPASIESVARAGKAVSPRTSFLAVNPKLGPSSTDFSGGLGISSRCGGCSISCGSRCGIRGIGTIGHGIESVDLNAILAGWLEPAVQACQALHNTPAHETTVNFELHSQEIADVTVETNGADEFGACVTEAAWEIQLDSQFYRAFDRRVVSLGR